MAPEDLLERLEAIAQEERVSLAEVIRQGMELRAARPGRQLRFIGVGSSAEPPHDWGRRSADLAYEPRSWR